MIKFIIIEPKGKMVSTKFDIFDTGRLFLPNYCPAEIQTMFKIHSERTNKKELSLCTTQYSWLI